MGCVALSSLTGVRESSGGDSGDKVRRMQRQDTQAESLYESTKKYKRKESTAPLAQPPEKHTAEMLGKFFFLFFFKGCFQNELTA